MTCAVTAAHDGVPCWAWTCLDDACGKHSHHDTAVQADFESAKHRTRHEVRGEVEAGTLRAPVVSHTHHAPDECPRCPT